MRESRRSFSYAVLLTAASIAYDGLFVGNAVDSLLFFRSGTLTLWCALVSRIKVRCTMWPILVLTFYCILIALASLVGGWLPAMMRLTHTRMQLMMSFVGGLMMAVALLHLMPHAVMETGSLDYASSSAVLGLLTIFFMIRVFHVHQHAPGEPIDKHDHEDPEDPDHLCHHHAHDTTTTQSHQLSWVGLFIGMSIHSLIDGIALAASVTVSAEHETSWGVLGAGTFVAVLLHKPLDSLPIATVMMAGGWSERWRHVVNIVYALICPAGALLFYFGVQGVLAEQHLAIGCALGFSAGVFLCISLADILPEIKFHQHDRGKLTAALLLGVALAYSIGLLEPKHAHDLNQSSGSQVNEHAGHNH
jgi:zinc and cadmium transporter